MTPKDIKKVLTQYLINSEKLIQDAILPATICIEGPAGISKTSLVKQLAKENGYKIHTIQMSQIDDLGHLVGFPQKEYAAVVTIEGSKKIKWFPEGTIQGKELTGEVRMSYALPYWLKSVKEDDKFILLLDDFTRSTPMAMQAIMQLVDEYKYGSWKLPKNTIIILTTNPDNGEYAVSSLDFAQKSRFIALNMQFDVDSWAEWAESAQIDSRCINFVLYNRDLFDLDETKEKSFNARSMTKYFQNIGTLSTFEDNLTFIQTIGRGSVGEIFTSMFITFIHNKLDKLPEISYLLDLNNSEDKSLNTLEKATGSYLKSEYKAPIASLLATRLVNYLSITENSSWKKENNERLIKLILSECFSEDIKIYMAKKMMAIDNLKVKSILSHPSLIKLIA